MNPHPQRDSNPAQAAPNWPPAVVLGAYLTGIVLMRELGRKGVAVCCVDWLREQPGFSTVYGPAYQCPNPDNEPAAWLSFMKELAAKLGGKPALIPSADQFVSAVAEHAKELASHFRFSQSAIVVQALLATKRKQYELAGEHGLPVPRTHVVLSQDDLDRFCAGARFPCILKPIHFREWQRLPADHPLYNAKLTVAKDAGELHAKYLLASEIAAEAVVQEIIEGPDTAKMVYLSCYASNGQRIGHCLLRQVRTYPIYFGSASVVEPIDDPETDQLCDRFLQSLGYVGICELELKRDTRDGRVKLIEANPRYSVTADAAIYAGVNLGWLYYLDLIGEAVQPLSPSGRDFRHIVLARDFATVRSYFKAGLLTWPALLRSYRPPCAFFDFDLKDWKVTLPNVVYLAKLVIGPFVRRFFPKRANRN